MAWFGSAQSVEKGSLPLAPAPISLLGTPTPPPDAALAASTATATALAAAKKVKKKAGATSLLTTPAAGVKAAVQPPKSLLGY